jgi:hypothetical protein
MNRAKKAALFNALLFPGWGQIYLKHYKKGILIIAGMTVGILSIFWGVVRQTAVIFNAAPLSKETVDWGAILQWVVKSIRGINLSYLLPLCLLLIILWFLSIIDAYVTGGTTQQPTISGDQQSAFPPD